MNAGVDDLTVHGSSEAKRPWSGRGRALALAMVLTLMLVLLASAVFSIANRSREVASRSIALHSLNESLRAATVVRAQATFAAYLASNDRLYGTNSKAAIRVAVTEARRNVDDLRTSFAENGEATLVDPQTEAALRRFTAAADRTLAATESNRPARAPILVRDQLAPSFTVARDRLVVQRDAALSDVKHAGSLLGRLGGLASFVIAFVLPTVTVIVYRQITQRSRETVALARSLAVERGRARRQRQLLARALGEIQAEFAQASAAEGSARASGLRRLGWDIEALSIVLTGAPHLAFADVRVGSALDAVASSLHESGFDGTLATADGAVWADGAALTAAVRNLALEAESAGSRRTVLSAVERDTEVEIVVAHDGAALTPEVSALVFDRAHDDERSAVEAGAAPLRLLAALELIEAMGGTLSDRTGSSGPEFVVRLPRGDVLHGIARADAVGAPAATVTV